MGADWNGRLADTDTTAVSDASDEDVAARLSDGSADARGDAGIGASSTVGLGTVHSCIADPSGLVRCWGESGFGMTGQIGPAPFESAHFVNMPEPIVGLSGGLDATCAIGTSGAVFCFGNNANGQLGRTLPVPKVTDELPARVQGLEEPIVSISLRGAHVCAALASGKVACWGRAFLTPTDSDRPVLVPGFPGPVRAVAVGRSHACAIVEGGLVACWGKNDSRQLGVEGPESATPVIVPLADRAVAIGAGRAHTCTLGESGSVLCWGANDMGQLGAAATGITARSTPGAVAGVSGARLLAVGDDHACTLTPKGAMTCWGAEADGRLGGIPLEAGAPVEVFGLPGDVDAIGAGQRHTCIRRGSAGAMCWGENGAGQLGNGDRNIEGPAPHAVDGW